MRISMIQQYEDPGWEFVENKIKNFYIYIKYWNSGSNVSLLSEVIK